MAEIGTGTSISYATGFFAEILDVSPPGASRESIQTSHMGTTVAHTFLPGDLVDWGELVVEMAFIASTAIPIDNAAEAIVISFPDSASSTWTFNGFMTGFEASVPLEERMTATATVKVTGDVTEA
jgi:hypothetical protein